MLPISNADWEAMSLWLQASISCVKVGEEGWKDSRRQRRENEKRGLPSLLTLLARVARLLKSIVVDNVDTKPDRPAICRHFETPSAR